MKLTRSAEAKALLEQDPMLRKYTSVIPCVKCGSAEMRIGIAKGKFNSVKCSHCENTRTANYRSTAEGKVKSVAAVKASLAKSLSTAEGQAKHNERHRAYKRKQRSCEPGRIKANEAVARWFKRNRRTANAWSKAYKTAKLKRTPAWADLKAIQHFYEACPAGYHVDHIIPLQGKLVSGLHVLENLQYLPASDNCSKNNTFDPMTFEAQF